MNINNLTFGKGEGFWRDILVMLIFKGYTSAQITEFILAIRNNLHSDITEERNKL